MTVAQARARYANLANWRGLPDDAVYWDESTLDGRATVAAAANLLNRPDLAAWAGAAGLDSLVVAALGRNRRSVSAAKDASRAVPVQSSIAPAKDAPAATLEIIVPGGNLRENLVSLAYPDFGIYVFRSRRLFLAVRCGAIGQRGRGGHAHNDQLAIELDPEVERAVDALPKAKALLDKSRELMVRRAAGPR